MGKVIKIALLVVLILLIGSAVFTDLPTGKAMLGHLDLSLYLKLVSLFGLLIALSLSLGYKHRMDSSQKYRRANAVLAEAEAKAKQQKKSLVQMEKKLKQDYAEKEQGLNSQIQEAYSGYEKRVKALNHQNVELKETATKLMRALKKERGKKGTS